MDVEWITNCVTLCENEMSCQVDTRTAWKGTQLFHHVPPIVWIGGALGFLVDLQ